MLREQVLSVLAEHKSELSLRYGVTSLALFGSVARGEESDRSDIDLLVEFERPVGFVLFECEAYLSQLLQRKVDLVTRKSVRTELQSIIFGEAIDA